MSTAADVEHPTIGEREVRMRDLSQRHATTRRALGPSSHPLDLEIVTDRIERARVALGAATEADAATSKAAEWFLDNYFLVRRVVRQVEIDLPVGFVRRLPEIGAGSEVGTLRLYALASELLTGSDARVDAVELIRVLAIYQEASPLTIGELWALPTMLRLRVLEVLAAALDGLMPRRDLVREASELAEAAASVERSVRALRVLAEVDWKKLFVRTSRVEAVLRRDPSGVYERMDFETCDRYRKAVEELAWSSARSEEEVALEAIELARAHASHAQLGHVGHYLLASGRVDIESVVAYRPGPLARLRRLMCAKPTATFFVTAALFTLPPVLLLEAYARSHGAGWPVLLATLLLGLLPASQFGSAAQRRFVAWLLPPQPLPKLDFEKGIADGHRTLVVVPALLDGQRDVSGLVVSLERHYLRNPDPAFQFALLTDLADSSSSETDDTIVVEAARGIAALNRRYGKDGVGPFHLLHREARWNEREGRFMGWERKRGKLEELNRLLRGDEKTSYSRHEGESAALRDIRYVITLDADTELAMGAGRRLVGLLAHPLNRATFDEVSGRLASGYTIVQPRVETSPSSARTSLFSRIFAGDVGLDIYSHASSDIHQDLFGSGIYVGKGIYDVDAFARSLAGRIPENSLVSHDLFEGIHGRVALATDISLFENYPSHYAAFARRHHRWVRGDWQLSPWLLPTVPSADGPRVPNALSAIDRWKIADNLRRSLVGVATVALLVAGWTFLPGSPVVWTIAALFLLVSPLLPSTLSAHERGAALSRVGLAVVFLAHEATIVLDAVVRVLVRLFVTRRFLLEWTPTARSEREVLETSQRRLAWREMRTAVVASCAVAVALVLSKQGALGAALPVLLAFIVAPEVASFISREVPTDEAERLQPADRKAFRLLARRTWLFFETFVGPTDQWLPVDNYQEAPREQTAHRTSPTNIGMMMLSTLAAYDFGYLAPGELAARLSSTLQTIERLSHHRGHLLNWYETKTLKPLSPEYVSTVDSGNFAGCLLALAEGCRRIEDAVVLRDEVWDGLGDTLDLFEDALLSAVDADADASVLEGVVGRMRAALQHGREAPDDAYQTLRLLCDEAAPELDRGLLELVGSGVCRHEADVLHALRTWMDRLHHQLVEARRLLDDLLPWLAMRGEPAAQGLELSARVRLRDVPATCDQIAAKIASRLAGDHDGLPPTPELVRSVDAVREACQSARARALLLIAQLGAVASRAEAEALGMDYRLLFDRERNLFRIGCNVTLDQVDAHHYDLLASEARLASYLAIVMGQAPESHWYALGRPMTRVGNASALLSWGGTMFEYLMPPLLMRSQRGTLLAESCRLAVQRQMSYGAERDAPWGVSESAFGKLDAHQTYQYRSFGVPGLGLKRGLADDLVIAPYATMLAAVEAPRSVAENARRLEQLGALGVYGLYEALDLGTSEEGRSEVVRSYMAHHQGMSLVALDNCLYGNVMVARFHSHVLVQKGELLLNERNPFAPPAEWTIAKSAERVAEPGALGPPSTGAAFGPLLDGRRQAFVLGNGRLSSIVTAEGGGGLRLGGLALTSYHPDPTHDEDGARIYVRDVRSGRVWLATSGEGSATFTAHKASFHRREQGISVHVDVTIAPADDVEIRQVTVRNETDEPRELSLTAVAEPVLLGAGDADRHPAFAKLFVETELVVDVDGMLVSRRPRSPKEERAVVLFRLVREGSAVSFAGAEGDRAAFFGRLRGASVPAALDAVNGLAGRFGATLDPLMAIMAHVKLKPRGATTFAFVTAVARSRSAVLELARRYESMHTVRWTLRDAQQEVARRLSRAHVDASLLPTIQRLFSAVLFADPETRAASQALAAAAPKKELLWGRSISGDNPVIVARVHDPDAKLLAELLAAHSYLRTCAIRVDLVLVDEQATGYANEGAGSLQRTLARHHCDEWMGQRGGIHLVARDQLGEAERKTLEASARVLLDTRDESLVERLARPPAPKPKLPVFAPARTSSEKAVSPVRPPLSFDNGFGGFSADGREYVIVTRPGSPTPAPWSNVLANPTFGCLVTESSLGSTWSLNAGENRLTPWRNDALFDVPSEVLYLRDEETGIVWSPTPMPAGRDADTLVRHGRGYTIFSRETQGLVQELTVFVPPGSSLKIVRLRLTNRLARHRRITATYYAEWVLGAMRDEQRPFIVHEARLGEGCLLATNSWNQELASRVAFLASERPIHGFTTDRTELLGRAGDYARPDGLLRWGLSGSSDAGVDPCAAIQVHLELDPSATLETHFILGQSDGRDEALALISRFRQAGAVDEAFSALGAFWDGILDRVRVKTPEPSMDLALGGWFLYQSIASRLFGRTGYFQSSGAYGFRDQLQDVLALVAVAPEIARAHILEAASHQFEEGDVLHWWHPPSGRGVRTRCSDDLVWLPFVTAEYVEATGDVSILTEVAPFLSAESLRRDEHDRFSRFDLAPGSGTLFEHCERALERAHPRGAHGLPLMGDGDWNDGMSRVGVLGRGESVWLGWFLCATQAKFADLCERSGRLEDASRWRADVETLRKSVEKVAWDGAWYLRAFHDDGSTLGSATNRECRIDSVAQTWAVLSGVGDQERSRLAMEAVETELVREDRRLVLLLEPPFSITPHDPGYIRAYPPGIRENGGQYTHAATWVGFAHARLGDGDRAERIFRLMNPILRTRTPSEVVRYALEPYVLAGDVYGARPMAGRGGWSWYTGAAAWAFRLGLEEILGLRIQEGALRVDPCIPASWPGFEARLRIGERRIHVVVDNPDRVCRGIAKITVDGLPSTSLVNLGGDSAVSIEVRVRLGDPRRAELPSKDTMPQRREPTLPEVSPRALRGR